MKKKQKKLLKKKNIDIGGDYDVSLNDILFNYAASSNFGIVLSCLLFSIGSIPSLTSTRFS